DGDRLGFPVFPLDWYTKDGEKYSGYKEQGYLPGAFINMLAFLGWNPGTEEEILSLKELEEKFELKRVSKSGAKFDAKKTQWFQQQYLRAQSAVDLAQKLQESFSEELKDYSKDYLATACELMKERAT